MDESRGPQTGPFFALAAAVIVLAVACIAIYLLFMLPSDRGASLAGKVWYWYETDSLDTGTTAVHRPEWYAVEFTPQGEVHIRADCNSGSSTYSSSADGSISIKGVARTSAVCPPDSEGDAFVTGLETAAHYRLEKGALTTATGYSSEDTVLLLELQGAKVTMKLVENLPQAEGRVDQDLMGVNWKAVEFSGPDGVTTVQDPERYTVEFRWDGEIRVQADCNQGGGSYSVSEGRVSIEVADKTMNVCSADSMGGQFVHTLNSATFYRPYGDILLLYLPEGSGTLKLVKDLPAPPPTWDPALVGTVWKWIDWTGPVPTDKLVVDYPDCYTIEFSANRTFRVQAYCEHAVGTYTADGRNISIELGSMTAAACSPCTLSNEFLTSLALAETYSIQENYLYLNLEMNGGAMRLAKDIPPTPTPIPTLTPVATSTPAATPSATPVVDSRLVGVVWQWFKFVSSSGVTTVDDPSRYTVQFMADGTVQARADCNQAFGTVVASNGSISISLTSSTQAACPSGSLGDEFVQALNAAAIYSFQGDVLLLDLPMDSGTMHLSWNPPPPGATPTPSPTRPTPAVSPTPPDSRLVGVIWQWIDLVTPGGVTTVDDPSRYTIQFLVDGTVQVLADCNKASGTYSADGSNISISLTQVTQVACPPGSLSDDYLKNLGIAAIYFFQDSSLYIDLQADSGTMQFGYGPIASPL